MPEVDTSHSWLTITTSIRIVFTQICPEITRNYIDLPQNTHFTCKSFRHPSFSEILWSKGLLKITTRSFSNNAPSWAAREGNAMYCQTHALLHANIEVSGSQSGSVAHFIVERSWSKAAQRCHDERSHALLEYLVLVAVVLIPRE